MEYNKVVILVNNELIRLVENGYPKDEIVRSFAVSLSAFVHADGTHKEREELNAVMFKGIEEGRQDIEKFIRRVSN